VVIGVVMMMVTRDMKGENGAEVFKLQVAWWELSLCVYLDKVIELHNSEV